jgi:tRNA A-37 threonylcarbamoyl transferase component Bud32
LGVELGHCRVIEKIGAGGMGEVYRAHDEHLDREVAIKVLPRGTLAEEGARQRFRKEAFALSKLNHPNIATVHDFDSEGNVDYLVMEYVPGKTLRDRISEGLLPEAEIIPLATQLAEGLIAAHQRGLVHRDLKPENVRLTLDGRVKILDFGLAKFIPSFTEFPSTTESHLWAAAGTLPYMAPEQVLSGVVDERSDLFSFGVILYEMATGTLPFRGDTAGGISDAILHSTPVPPLKLNPTLSIDLETIIIKALEKDRNLRYQSASEMRTDLKRLTRDTDSGLSAEVSAASRALAERSHKARVRWKMLVPVGVLVAVLALAVAFWLGRGGRGSAGGTASIAVLPFVDMSPEKNQEYFSDGLAEELLNDLAKIQGLRVAARTSSFQFKGKTEDLRTVGEKLNVGAILEGSVRKQGSRVRVTAQLIKVEDL